MIENKEVKIALIVGMIMVTVCLLAIIFNKANTTSNKSIDLKVYKLYDKEGNKEEHEYRACSISTDDLITINSEFKKAQNLSEEKRLRGKQINGNYKIIANDYYIAFDGEEDAYVYRSDTGALYTFESPLYDYVKKICGENNKT